MATDKTIPPAYLVIAAEDIPGKYYKGDIIEVLASGSLKSDWCIPPRYIWATITDKTKNQINVYLKSWKIRFIHTLINENNDGWRYEIAVDPLEISISNQNKSQMKQKMIDYLTSNFDGWGSIWYKSSINSWTPDSIIIDVPKPYQGNPAYEGTDPEWILWHEGDWPNFLQELKYDFHDKFYTTFLPRRYYFNPDSVDLVIANFNGEWEGTHIQALNHIMDKLNN